MLSQNDTQEWLLRAGVKTLGSVASHPEIDHERWRRDGNTKKYETSYCTSYRIHDCERITYIEELTNSPNNLSLHYGDDWERWCVASEWPGRTSTHKVLGRRPCQPCILPRNL